MKLVRLFTTNVLETDSTVESSGGKGHNLIEMKLKHGLNVPAGLVIPTEVCNSYRSCGDTGKKLLMDSVMTEVMDALETHVWPEATHHLVSVRSGAPVSMPGMMDTILNVGAGYDDKPLHNTLKADCRKRFVDMYADVVMGHDKKITNHDEWMKSIKKNIPDLRDVIRNCIEAVFKSWDNERAKHYRRMNDISDEMGTAVVIQSMVFGNFNMKSGSGVYFTRNPNSGDKRAYGDFLANCQGEDVVAGTVTAPPIADMQKSKHFKKLHKELIEIGNKLEVAFADMQDIEFTIEDGELFILQARRGKRSAKAEIKIALDLLDEGLIADLGERVSKGTFPKLREPTLPESFTIKPVGKGIASGGYFATGKACFNVQSVLNANEPAILVAEETTPDDIKGMEKAVGILTFKGGATSHAAVVARGMNKPCVVGAGDLAELEMEYVLIDGQTGRVWLSDVPFNLDLSSTLPVDLLGPLLELTIDESDWVAVESYDEAILLEDYIYKVGIPVGELDGDQLADLAERFDKVVLINPERSDRTSDFLGTPELNEMNRARHLDEQIANNPAMDNVFFDSGDWVMSNVAQAYKTMADVMNPDFIGYIEKDFIDNVMGGMETFETISEQLGLSARIVKMESALTLLEKRIKIG